MDISRPDISRRNRRRRILLGTGALIVVASVTVVLARLEPPVPKVDRDAVWTGTVERGSMVREVRGHGSLVPEEIRWVTASGSGTIEHIPLLPGVTVAPETVLLEMSNPELVQAVIDAESEVRVSEARLERLKVQLESEMLAQEATITRLESDLALMRIEAEIDEALRARDFLPESVVRRSRAQVDDLEKRLAFERKRMEFLETSRSAQLLVQEAELEKASRQADLNRDRVAGLTVRAGMNGVLQELGNGSSLRVGQRLSAGATVARIADDSRLKAEIRVSETQAGDVRHGQSVTIDTRNGIVYGRVVRIDPAVRQGTVTVDVAMEGSLPQGARPDLSVSGTITLERLDDVLFVGRPVRGQSGERAALFKVVNGGREAVRTPVRLGQNSISVIEVEDGLGEGDEVILSDMGRWEEHDRIRLR